MKNLNRRILIGAICLSLFSLSLTAQDDATYVDDMPAEDSSYADDIFMPEEAELVEAKGSNTGLYLGLGAGFVVVAGIGIMFMKKKK